MLLKYFIKKIFNRALGKGHTNQSLMHKYTVFLFCCYRKHFRYVFSLNITMNCIKMHTTI